MKLINFLIKFRISHKLHIILFAFNLLEIFKASKANFFNSSMIHIYIISFTSQTNLSRRQDKGFLIKFMIKCFPIIEIESKNIGIDSKCTMGFHFRDFISH